MYNFRNDYSVSAHPAVLEAVARLGSAPFPGYGSDPCCRRAEALIRDLCQAPQAAVHFFVGGTAANLTAIAALLRPWEGVIAPTTGHINVHEAGSVEATGHKIIPVPTPDGKLTPAHLAPILELHRDTAMVLPRLVYLSQATEIGTVYNKEELEALSRFCRAHGLLLFLDGARLATALTAPDCGLTLADLAVLTDAFYIGGTKNGALMGEAMVIPDPALQPHFFRAMKRQGAVLAKGFLLGAQFEALLKDGLYWDLARHANAMAQTLQTGLTELGLPMLHTSPTNQIFPLVPNSLLPALEELCSFEVWDRPDAGHTVIRLVTSFATTREEVSGLLSGLRPLV